jgi:hypothetical protein
LLRPDRKRPDCDADEGPPPSPLRALARFCWDARCWSSARSCPVDPRHESCDEDGGFDAAATAAAKAARLDEGVRAPLLPL